jgi:hypothetical protein
LTTQAPIHPVVQKRIRDAFFADPVERMRKTSGFVGWSKQHEVIRALYEHRLVTVRASHGVGKTAVAGALVDDFMRQGPCRIVTTAPTWHQVKDQLWGEIHSRVDNAPVPWVTKPRQARWKIREDWLALGLSTNRPERFQGHHGKRVLFIVDEASGVDEAIFDAGMGFLTGENTYVLYIGNPNQTRGEFHRSHQPDSGFKRIHMSTFDCPAWTGEAVSDELAAILPSKRWHAMMLARVNGKTDHPFYRVRVLGEFANLVGRPYFDDQLIDKIEPQTEKRRGLLEGDPVKGSSVQWVDHPHGEIRIWDAPKKGRKYLIFGDVAGQVREDDWVERDERDPGEGDDYCCADVLDLETGQQVAQLHARMDPDVYGRALARLGWVYQCDGKPAWIGVEANSMGQATLAILKNHRYPRVWRRNKRENASQAKSASLGLVTTRDSKERILAYLTETVREAPARIRSERTRDELRTFEYTRNGYGGAASGYHDDAVISMAAALEMRDQVLRRPLSDEKVAA